MQKRRIDGHQVWPYQMHGYCMECGDPLVISLDVEDGELKVEVEVCPQCKEEHGEEQYEAGRTALARELQIGGPQS